MNASVGERAFENCTALESVRFQNDGECQKDAFKNCTAIQSVYIERRGAYSHIDFWNIESNPLHCGAMLYDADGLVTHVDYSVSMGDFNRYSFYGCESLTSVHIDAEKIGPYVFANCVNLRYVTMTEKAKASTFYGRPGCGQIGESAFLNCGNLEWIEIGYNCTSIHETAFSNCGKLQTVYLEHGQERWTALCSQVPAFQNVTVVLQSLAPAEQIDHNCEGCKRTAN